jgi:excisionase family DNA binding protein
MNQLFTPKEAADFLRWSPATLYNYSSLGKIVSIKVGRSLRFRRKDLVRLLRVRPAQEGRPR